MIGRRAALQAIGLGALAAPAAARQVAADTIGGLNARGLVGGAGQVMSAQTSSWERAALAFADKDTREAIRASFYRQHKSIHILDADIANKRSFSLAAKIAFQRQRNVETEMESILSDGWGNHAYGIIEKFLGVRR